MLQTTITIIIVFTAGIIALNRFIRFFTSPQEKCNGCSQRNGGCSLEGLKKELEMKNSPKSNFTNPSV